MTMYEILLKKRNGEELKEEELDFFVKGCVDGTIPDYQISAFLMAVYFRGMTEKETTLFTQKMASSGDMVDLSMLPLPTVDKHSTGGVGDKTTLIVVPIVASCGVIVPKMSGKGLGHTGGTIDKLSAIPGFQTEISKKRFEECLIKNHAAIISQSGNLAPADKILYALRDVTATVDSLPLIASSIMGKKLASGADSILLDVKTGSGALMHDLEGSVKLAQTMVNIGNNAGKRTAALITDMDTPLGFAVGNALEVIEAIQTLRMQGPVDLTKVCLELAAGMLCLAGKGNYDDCFSLAQKALEDGSAFHKLKDLVREQGGDPSYIEHPEQFVLSPAQLEITAPCDGYLSHIDTLSCGMASVLLGAGRQNKEDKIDLGAGILLLKTVGDFVHSGEPIAQLYCQSESLAQAAQKKFHFQISKEKPSSRTLILQRIGF